MNREQVIELAKQAHGPITQQWWDMDVAALERFAELVAAAEREACAKVCEDIEKEADALWDEICDPYEQGRSHGAVGCAAAIRARNTNKETK